ncbi:MAG: PstS family phosphate ABC transporter substrate-binding protein [Nitrospiria bacterium]
MTRDRMGIGWGFGLAIVAVSASAWAAPLVKVDGSSTVFPITEAVAEEFQAKHPKVRVTVGISGTGGGFKKFCGGEIDLADASRPIKRTEVEQCLARKIDFIEIPVAYDGLAVLVNPSNTWAVSMTVKELKKLWEPAAQGKITRWSQIRTGWPDKEIHLFGAGVDSGTYDYFTEAVVGTEHASRGDFTASEDDNVLIQGIATDPLALGFFGLAYYDSNKARLKLVAIDDENPKNGAGPILPSEQTVMNGTYQPLARPIFIYASVKALARPEITDFVTFYLTEGRALVREVGYIPLQDQVYELGLKRVAKRVTGSVFEGKGSQIGVTLESLLAAESR